MMSSTDPALAASGASSAMMDDLEIFPSDFGLPWAKNRCCCLASNAAGISGSLVRR